MKRGKHLNKSLLNLSLSSGFLTSRTIGLHDLSIVVLKLNVKYWTIFVIVQNNCISRNFIFFTIKSFFSIL